MKKLAFFSLILALTLSVLLTASFTASAANGKIAFGDESGLSVYDGRYVMGLPIGAKVSDLTDRLALGVTAFAANKDNGTRLAESDVIFTGTKIRSEKYGFVTDELLAVIKGDLDGSGSVRSNDYLKIKRHFAGRLMTELEFAAADITEDGEIKSTDYLAVKKYFQGKYNLYPPMGPATSGEVPAPTENPNSLSESVEYANLAKNSVQAHFSDGDNRSRYIMSNAQLVVYQNLTETGKKNAALVTNPDGGVYLENTLDTYIVNSASQRIYLRDSVSSAAGAPNVVTTRLGYYFYENHIRNLYFPQMGHLLDLSYNMLPDRTSVQNRFVYKGASGLDITIGAEVRIEKSRVLKSSLNSEKGYYAFDIEGAGVIGFIIPEGAIYQVNVTEENNCFVLRFEALITSAEKDKDYNIVYRIYADETHSFDGVEKATREEKETVGVTVGETVNTSASYEGYSYKYGMYELNGMIKYGSFTTAYKNPNELFLSETSFDNGDTDRVVWVYWNTPHGGLECGTVMDENGKLLAVPTEVCKNFKGEYEDPTYDPDDTAYGDCVYPIYLKANRTEKIKTSLFLQNWGIFPCQQISSIQFFSTYYHMSTGVTETTCIAPTGTTWKDGLIFPDFRGASGYFWDNQPQHCCAGFMRFFHIEDDAMNANWPEYTGSEIISSGPTYGEMDYSYVADDGTYKYTIKHLEFPQLDESRNYQELEVEFLEDVSIRMANKKLKLFSNDNASGGYRKLAYLDENGESIIRDVVLGSTDLRGTLKKGSSYFAIYNTKNGQTENFGVVIQDYDITLGGEKWDGNLCFEFTSTRTPDGLNLTDVYFAPSAKRMEFKAGDKITLRFVLLPFGRENQDNFDNVLNVYNDSALNPISVDVIKGTPEYHNNMAVIVAENGEAEFNISGSAGYNTILVKGFNKDDRPLIEEMVDGVWIEYVTSSSNGYDGYGTSYETGGTYSFSWVADMGNTGTERHFRVIQN